MTIKILEPHGFCAGVANALRRADELAKDSQGEKIYCLHELVHNELVVADLAMRGFIFVESLDEIPRGATVLFSAHGVSPAIRDEAICRELKIVDATCPFVARVHRLAKEFSNRDLPVVILGHPNHVEVIGILGEAKRAEIVQNLSDAENYVSKNSNLSRIGIVSQTTMNADDVRDLVDFFKHHFEVESSAEVCVATKERQDAVKSFSGDALLVLGSVNSSNTRRLCDVANCKTFRVSRIEDVEKINFSSIRELGITSGASTPEKFFNEVVSFLREQKGN